MFSEWASSLRLRLRALLHRRRLNQDLEDEMRFHLDERADSYRREGMGATEAERLSRRRFGNTTAWTEACKEMWGFGWLERAWRDLRYAARSLSKTPGFTAVVALTLAVGIGAGTAIFTVFDSAVLRASPYEDPSRLVLLWGNVQRQTVERRGTSLADYADWRDESSSFESMSLYASANFTVTGAGEPERLQGEFVAQPYFEALGVNPVLGRAFRPDEDSVPQRDAVVVLGADLWRQRYGADPDIVGGDIVLNGRSYTVVGVTPHWFRGLSDSAALWVPLHMVGPAEAFRNRGGRGPAVLAKLKPGVSIGEAQAEMDGICKRLEQAYPRTNEARGVELSPLENEILGGVRQPLLILLAAAMLLLLIACANVANLLLVRAEARQREVAVRSALGSGRGRTYVHLAMESALLVALGAAGGIVAAHWGVRALVAGSPIALPSYVQPSVDFRILLCSVALTGALTLLLSLAPAVYLRGVRLDEVFRQSSRSTTAGSGRIAFRKLLVVSEVALAMLLLVGAGLLARSLDGLASMPLGFEPDGVLTLRVSAPAVEASASEVADAQSRPASGTAEAMLTKLASLPAVESVAAGSDTPLTGSSAIFYSAEGVGAESAQTKPRAYVHRVTGDFFQALRIPVVDGATFTPAQQLEGADVVIVSKKVAERFWPGESPIGKRIKAGAPDSDRPWLSIVGVVGETNYRGIPTNPTDDPDLFFPFTPRQRTFSLVVRTSLSPDSMAASVRDAVREVEPNAVVASVTTLESAVADRTSPQRFTGWLMGVFAAAALILAMIGIYGLLSYSVGRRSQEIGIRMALGANRARILRSVVTDGLTLVAAGLLLGGAAALALTRLLESVLYGIQPSDPLTFAAAAVGLAAAALIGAVLPAVQATRIAPAEALRADV